MMLSRNLLRFVCVARDGDWLVLYVGRQGGDFVLQTRVSEALKHRMMIVYPPGEGSMCLEKVPA